MDGPGPVTRSHRSSRLAYWASLVWCVAAAFLVVAAVVDRAWVRLVISLLALAVAGATFSAERGRGAAARSRRAALGWPPERVAELLDAAGVPVSDRVGAVKALHAADPALLLTDRGQLVVAAEPLRAGAHPPP